MTDHLDDLFVLSDREFATVLCALRTIQDSSCDARVTCEDHFQEHAPLTDAEIDDLCERLNTKDVPLHPDTNAKGN